MRTETAPLIPLPSVSFWQRWVTPVFVIAHLTVKEAVRRWVFASGFSLGIGMALLLAYVFANVKRHGELLPAEVQASLIVHFGLVTVRFFGAVMAIALACGAIATELDKGTLGLIVTKPVRRWQVVVGKWLGFAFILTINQLVWLAVLAWGAWDRTGTWHVGLWRAGIIGLLYPLLFVSLCLLFSVHLPWLTVALIALVFMGVGWSETVMRNIGTLANLPRLVTLSQIAGWLMPTGRLARWMFVQSGVGEIVPQLAGPPMLPMPKPTLGDLLYVAAYIVGVLVLACWLFRRREITG